MGARTAIQLALVASTTVLMIHSTPSHLGHQRRGELPARGQGIPWHDPGTAAARAAGDARHQATLVRPTAFVPPSRPASPRDVFGQLPLSVEPNVGQASDGVQFVARGRSDSIALTRAETVLMRGSIGPASQPVGAARMPEGPAVVDVDASGDLALRLEDGDQGRRLRRPVALPECLMPRNSCRYSTEK